MLSSRQGLTDMEGLYPILSYKFLDFSRLLILPNKVFYFTILCSTMADNCSCCSNLVWDPLFSSVEVVTSFCSSALWYGFYFFSDWYLIFMRLRGCFIATFGLSPLQTEFQSLLGSKAREELTQLHLKVLIFLFELSLRHYSKTLLLSLTLL